MALDAIYDLPWRRHGDFRTYAFRVASGVTIDSADVLIGKSTAGRAGPLTGSGGDYPTFLGMLLATGEGNEDATLDPDGIVGDAAGTVEVVVAQQGVILGHESGVDVTGVTAETDVGATVYASDHRTLTLTSSSNTAVGKVKQFVSTGVAVVELNAASA
jgi:hypothetical protein